MNVTTFLNAMYDDGKKVRGEVPKRIDLSKKLWDEYMSPSCPPAHNASTTLFADMNLMSDFARIIWSNESFDESLVNVTTFLGYSVCPPKKYKETNQDPGFHLCVYSKYVGFREMYEFCTVCDKKRDIR